MILEVVEKYAHNPSSLRDISVQAVSCQVIEAIWRGTINFQTIYIPEPVERNIREWVTELPPIVRQDLMNQTVRQLIRSLSRVTAYSSSTIPIVIASLAEALYSPSMNSLEVWTDLHWHQEARMKLLHLLHSRPTAIKTLMFSCYKTPIFQFQELHFSERFLLMNVLNKFPALRTLILPYVGDDELLAKLGAGSCPLLEHLNVEGSWGVGNQGLAALAGQDGGMVIGRAGWVPSHFAQCEEGQKLLGSILKGSPVTASQITSLMAQQRRGNTLLNSLKHLNVRGTGIDCRGLECVLQNFVNLLGLEAEEQHFQNLLVSAGCDGCFPKNLSLDRINLRQNTYSLLKHVVRIFPNLRSITLTNYERSEAFLDGEDNLKLLHALPHLRELNLVDVDLSSVYHHLESDQIGPNLETFRYTSRLRIVDVALLASLCPNLLNISISNSVIHFKMPVGRRSAIFPRLRTLTFSDVTFPVGQQAAWKEVIRHSHLEQLSLHNIRLTDGDISDVVKSGRLARLEEINISSTTTILLSEASVYRLLDSCPKLARIGGICCWSHRSMVDLLDTLHHKYRFKINMGEDT